MEYKKWKWRERYIRFQGELHILEGEGNFAGRQYLYFTDHSGNWLTTGYGEYRIDGKRLTMTTKNSIYEFEIIHGKILMLTRENFKLGVRFTKRKAED